jgi:hypothetical protein
MLVLFSALLFTGMIILKSFEEEKIIKVSAQIENESFQLKLESPQTFINNIVLNDSIISSDTIK